MARRLLDSVVRELPLPRAEDERRRMLLDSEWLVTNGLGGYASGTVAGVNTRRYHGLLVAALENPLGRTVMLNQLDERLARSGETVSLGDHVDRFRLEAGLPVWEFAVADVRVERAIVMVHGQNTVHLRYRLLSGSTATLQLRPGVHFRGYEDPVDSPVNDPSGDGYGARWVDGRLSVDCGDIPPLRLRIDGGARRFTPQPALIEDQTYPVEESRGYQSRGLLWSPGSFTAELASDLPVTLVVSAEADDVIDAVPVDWAFACERERRRRMVRSASLSVGDPIGAELVLAADQFIVTPRGRKRDSVRAKAVGDEIRTVIAGYHWFTDWGRDTMISLEGLTLVTGRHREAAFILRTFAEYVRDGLIPNMFPDGSNEGLYHTADATLWFFHAVHRYALRTGDDDLVLHLLPVLTDIADHHIRGTHFGIGMDPADALLRQGAEGYQLTWMDAKVDGWVVTPRRGKAVEINALWYNALRLLAGWLAEIRGEAAGRPYRDLADRAQAAFNARYWIEELGYLRDVIDGEKGDSTECRPNQLFAISLDHPVLARDRWDSVVRVVKERLLTPVGLRSLAPGEPEYKPRYFGDLRTRDAAYHQGTVWGWLIGPWIDAWLRVHPDDRAGARRYLDGLVDHLGDFGIGSVAEIFDATPPFTARGCVAQAWSVAELLRCWERTAHERERTPGLPRP